MNVPILQAGHSTLLHPPAPAYAPELYRLIRACQPHLRPWLSWVEEIHSHEDTRRFLLDALRFNAGGQRLTFLIVHEGALAGAVGFVRIDRPHQRAELGYWLDHRLQGQGIIARCCHRLLRYAFEELALNRITIRTLSENSRSRNIPRRLGFRHEGTLRQENHLHGRFHDVELYAFLKKDWQNP